jgi:hypothetical protein
MPCGLVGGTILENIKHTKEGIKLYKLNRYCSLKSAAAIVRIHTGAH